MVKVYVANISNLPDPWTRPLILGELPEERVEKAMRIRRSKERKQSLGAGLLLEYAKRELGEGYFLNLSHSDDYVICAASEKKVGCDIEKIKEAPIKVAERYFYPSEADYLKGLSEEKQGEEFFRLWTIKESYTKMTGRGLSMGLKSFEVIIDENDLEGVLIFKDGERVNCNIKEYELEGYKVSVCAEEELFADEMDIIEL